MEDAPCDIKCPRCFYTVEVPGICERCRRDFKKKAKVLQQENPDMKYTAALRQIKTEEGF